MDIDEFLIRPGKPHSKTAFRGDGNPTDDQVSREIGSSIMQIYLGLATKVNIDDLDAQRQTTEQPDEQPRVKRVIGVAISRLRSIDANLRDEGWRIEEGSTRERIKYSIKELEQMRTNAVERESFDEASVDLDWCHSQRKVLHSPHAGCRGDYCGLHGISDSARRV